VRIRLWQRKTIGKHPENTIPFQIPRSNNLLSTKARPIPPKTQAR
jgi:hypothetical protein